MNIYELLKRRKVLCIIYNLTLLTKKQFNINNAVLDVMDPLFINSHLQCCERFSI